MKHVQVTACFPLSAAVALGMSKHGEETVTLTDAHVAALGSEAREVLVDVSKSAIEVTTAPSPESVLAAIDAFIERRSARLARREAWLRDTANDKNSEDAFWYDYSESQPQRGGGYGSDAWIKARTTEALAERRERIEAAEKAEAAQRAAERVETKRAKRAKLAEVGDRAFSADQDDLRWSRLGTQIVQCGGIVTSKELEEFGVTESLDAIMARVLGSQRAEVARRGSDAFLVTDDMELTWAPGLFWTGNVTKTELACAGIAEPKEAILEHLLAQLRSLARTVATGEQAERLDAGVLPYGEMLAMVDTAILPAPPADVASMPYVKITRQELLRANPDSDYCETNKAVYSAVVLTELSTKEWAVLKAARAWGTTMTPPIGADIIEHKGYLEDDNCPEVILRSSLRLRRTMCSRTVVRSFAIDE